MKKLLLAVTMAAAVSVTAFGVTVDYYTSRTLAPGQLGLCHVLVTHGDGDWNGPGNSMERNQIGVDDQGNPTYNVGASVRTPNGIPDGAEFGVLEYIYATPGTPHRDALIAAFEHNRNALFYWTGNGPCEDPRTLFVDGMYCDDFGGVLPRLCFPGCSLNNALILRKAAHATVSRNMGPGAYFSRRWEWFNGFRDLDVSFDDPRFDRSMLDIFAEDGDINGDGYTNLEIFQSVMRALNMSYDETEPWRWPLINGSTPSRAQKDMIVGRYIQYAVLTPGLDHDDPLRPPDPVISRQSGGRWIEAAPDKDLTLFIEVKHVPEPITYLWRKNGVPLEDGGRVSGSASADLRIAAPLESGDSGTYVCVATYDDTKKAQLQSAPIHILVVPEGSLPVRAGGILAVLLAAAGGAVLAGWALRKPSPAV